MYMDLTWKTASHRSKHARMPSRTPRSKRLSADAFLIHFEHAGGGSPSSPAPPVDEGQFPAPAPAERAASTDPCVRPAPQHGLTLVSAVALDSSIFEL
jgi:hypothetical protein